MIQTNNQAIASASSASERLSVPRFVQYEYQRPMPSSDPRTTPTRGPATQVTAETKAELQALSRRMTADAKKTDTGIRSR